ncbi:hypothetical protein N658DRAFT_213224 [Parathielavia hyrcaniae]|uniref:Uncharacterized protein n=1 Tax=Parathielavia hyrcaniae TaxID=113614 RepID=A0AAN6Q0D3_9PEZI|nr:hypothetical protein N658DRAFT_213224 [Parathielavia hyrcaniae]
MEQLVSLGRAWLPRLTTLSFRCELPSFNVEETTGSRSDYFRAIETFCSGLPSLKALEVTAWDHAQHVFSFDNARLERLSLVPAETQFKPAACQMQQHLTLDGLKELTSSFPRLTDLSVPVKKSRGSSAEVALYRHIGEHLPNFRRLSLSLDCSPPRLLKINSPEAEAATDQSPHPRIVPTGFDTPRTRPYPSGPGWPAAAADLNRERDGYARGFEVYRNGHIYDVLINAALDGSLARSIFAAVGGNVETLLVKTYGGLYFSQYGPRPLYGFPRRVMSVIGPLGKRLKQFMTAVEKQWMVEKLNDKVAVEEMGLERSHGFDNPIETGHVVRDHLVVEFFRRVWPG